MLHHGYHHQVTNMGDGIEIRDTKDKLSKMYFLQTKVLSGNNRSSVLVLALLAQWQLVYVSGGDR